MPDMLVDTCLTLRCYKLVVENAVAYSLLVSKKSWWYFSLLYFYGVSCFSVSLISAEVGNLVLRFETWLQETKYILVSRFGFFYFFT